MKEDIKNIWVKALRSGDYQQGKETLRNKDNQFCCLGVLCDLHSKMTNDGEFVMGEYWRYKSDDVSWGSISFLSPEVINWAGMASSNGRFKENTLTNLNDTGHTFLEIATEIEKHWETL